VYSKYGLLGQRVVCGGECLVGFSSLLGTGLTYTWGGKHVFSEGCISLSVSSSRKPDGCLLSNQTLLWSILCFYTCI